VAARGPRGAGACVPKPSCGFSSDRERPIFSLSRTIQETAMPAELAVEKGTGSDAVSTLSNYLTIREMTSESLDCGLAGCFSILHVHAQTTIVNPI